MSSFFTLPKSQKRKRSEAPQTTTKKARTSTSTSNSKGNTGSTQSSRNVSSRNGISRVARDESISGSESDRSDAGDEGYESAATDASEERETAAEKRLRLAEEYLEKVRQETEQEAGEYGFDAEQIDKDLIAERLKEDVAELKGKIYRWVAGGYEWKAARGGYVPAKEEVKASTAVAVANTNEGAFVYTATKDSRILKWRIPEKRESREADEDGDADVEEKGVARPELSKSQRRRLRAKRRKDGGGGISRTPVLIASTRGSHKRKKDSSYDNHVAPILCLAASPSGHLLVSGGEDKRIIVWDTETLTPKRVFTQHRAAVTGLAFRRTTNQMFSASADRTIKVWSMDEIAYVETLFGHQDEVLDVGALGMERCVSVGGRDRTARVWKVVDETQLVFRGGGAAAEREAKKDRKRGAVGSTATERAEKKAKAAYGEGSIDRVALVDDEMFITGSDNGNLSLWSTQKKKPVHIVPLAHGLDPQLSLEEAYPDLEMGDKEIPGPPLPRAITALAVLPYSDVVVTGSWEGFIRIWKISADKKRLEPAGTIGAPEVAEMALTINTDGLVNGIAKKLTFETEPETNGADFPIPDDSTDTLTKSDLPVATTGEIITDDPSSKSFQTTNHSSNPSTSRHAQRQNLAGIINDLKIIERGPRGKEVLIVAAALGKEPRLGRWRTFKGRNGVCVWEIHKAKKVTKGGLDGDGEEEMVVNGNDDVED